MDEAPTKVAGRWDAPASTVWNNGSWLWVSPQELRVTNANGWGRDRVVRRDHDVDLRLSPVLRGTKLAIRRSGARRWRQLCIVPRSSHRTITRALQGAGWIEAGGRGGTPAGTPPFFQVCRTKGLPRRRWLVVEGEWMSVQCRRSGCRSSRRRDVTAVRIDDRGDGTATVVLLLREQQAVERLGRSLSPEDLTSALVERGWPRAEADPSVAV